MDSTLANGYTRDGATLTIKMSKVPSEYPSIYIAGWRAGLYGDQVLNIIYHPAYLQGHKHGSRVRNGLDPIPEWHKYGR